MLFIVDSLSQRKQQGYLRFNHTALPCVLGRSGRTAFKREGDGATPMGLWTFREAFYRADRVQRPRTRLPLSAISRDDGWCDEPGDRNYNRYVKHPYPSGAEHLWREDNLYDLLIVIGYNDRPRVQGAGSAIFMHLTSADLKPTEGCIALGTAQILRVLALAGTRSKIRI